MSTMLRGAPVPPPLPGEEPADERAPFIDEQIDRTRSQVKWNEVALHGVILGACVLGVLLLLALVDHWLVGLGGWGRGLAFLCIATGSIYYIARWIVPPLWQTINPVYAAHTIEEAQPELKNSLVNFLFFRAEPKNVRPAILTALEERAAKDLHHAPVDTAVDRSQLIQASYVLAGVLTVFALYTVISPKDPFQTLARVAFPWAEIARPSRVQIADIKPGDVTTYYGYEVIVTANVRGVATNDPVTLIYSTADGQVDKREVPMQRGEDGLSYRVSLPPEPTGVEQAMTYKIVAGDAETVEYKVEVLPAPSIAIRNVRCDLPEYTGEPDRDAGVDGDLRAIEGTRVTLHLEANQEIKSGYVEFDPQGVLKADGKPEAKQPAASPQVALAIDPKNPKQAAVTFTLLLKQDRRTPLHRTYQVRFLNGQGDRNERPVEHAIEVLPDQSPTVEILEPKQREIELPVSGEQAFEARALDPDFKLTKVILRGDARGQTLFTVPLMDAPVGVVGQVLPPPYRFKPAEHRLKPGDVVVIWAEASDNRTSPYSRLGEPNVSATEKFTIKIVAPKTNDPRAENMPPMGGQKPPMGQEQPMPGEMPPQGQQQPNEPNGGANQKPPMGNPNQQNPGAGGMNEQPPPQGGQPNEEKMPPQPGQEERGNPMQNQGGGQGGNTKQPNPQQPNAGQPNGQGGGEGGANQRPMIPEGDPRQQGPKKPNERPNQRPNEQPMGSEKKPEGNPDKQPNSMDPSGASEGATGQERGNPMREKPMGGQPMGQEGADMGGNTGAGGSNTGGQSSKTMKPAGGNDTGMDSGKPEGSDAGGTPMGGQPGDPTGQGGQPNSESEQRPLDADGRDDGEIVERTLRAIEDDIRKREGEEGVRKFREKLDDELRKEEEKRGQQPMGGQPQPMGQQGQPKPMGENPMGGQPQPMGGQPMGAGQQPMPGGPMGQQPMGAGQQPMPGGPMGQQPMGGQPMAGQQGTMQDGGMGGQKPMPGGPMGQQPNGQQPMGAAGNMNPQGQPGGAQGDMPMAGGQSPMGQQPMAGGMKPGGEMQPGGSEGMGPMGTKPMAGGMDPSGMPMGGGQNMQPMGPMPGGAKPMPGQEGSSGMNQGQGPMQSGGQNTPGGMPMGGAETMMQPMGPMPSGSEQPGMGQNGNTGGGMKPMQPMQGAPESQGGGQQGNKPEMKPGPMGGSQGGEAQSPSTSKKPSQSQGGEGGDKSGGGKQGGGQGGMQPGQDSAGGSTPGDSGSGQADQKGNGENGKKGGNGQIANQPTGHAGQDQGEGSTSKAGQGKTGQGQTAKKTPGEGTQPGQSGGSRRPGQTPSGSAGTQPGSGGVQPAGTPQPAGPDVPQVPEDFTPTAPEPDPEYAKKATQLTLEYLKSQSENPDPELLKRLGAQPGDKDFVKRFVDRWEKMYRDANDPTAKGNEARAELDDTLKGLGLRKQSDAVRSADQATEGERGQDAGRSRPPRDYEDLYRAYNKGLRGLKTTP